MRGRRRLKTRRHPLPEIRKAAAKRRVAVGFVTEEEVSALPVSIRKYVIAGGNGNRISKPRYHPVIFVSSLWCAAPVRLYDGGANAALGLG